MILLPLQKVLFPDGSGWCCKCRSCDLFPYMELKKVRVHGQQWQKYRISKGAKGMIREKESAPSMDQWLKEAKKDPQAASCGMYLFHNGVVRQTAKASVREGKKGLPPVAGLIFSYDEGKVEEAIRKTYEMPGIYYVKVWLNQGELEVGDDMMRVLVGGDIRPHVIDALQALVEEIKTGCVEETETF